MNTVQPVLNQSGTMQVQKAINHDAANNAVSGASFLNVFKTAGTNLFMPVQGKTDKDNSGIKKHKFEKNSSDKTETVYDLIGRVEAMERSADRGS